MQSKKKKKKKKKTTMQKEEEVGDGKTKRTTSYNAEFLVQCGDTACVERLSISMRTGGISFYTKGGFT